MGNIVHATDTAGLVVITQLQPIAVIFTLPQDQLPGVIAKIRGGGRFRSRRTIATTLRRLRRQIATIDNQIDPTTGTYKLKAVFWNENNVLFPNQFVNVHLLVDTKHNVSSFRRPRFSADLRALTFTLSRRHREDSDGYRRRDYRQLRRGQLWA